MRRNMKQVGKTVVSGLVILGLLMGNVTFVQAEKVVKEESVYVNAGADGTVDKITVSDWLKNAGINGSVSDVSNLQDIQNVKGDETFEQDGNGVRWNAVDKDIYYQGTIEKNLPVEVNITYQLDGEEISPEEIAGKSGDVTIRVSYTNHSKVKKDIEGEEEALYTPFFMVTGVILPTDKFTEVEVDGAKVINEGNNQIVVGYGVPGMADSLQLSGELADKLQDSFEIRATVTDFSMGNTLTYASAGILSELDVEDEDTFEDLEKDLETLVDSSEELVSGSEKIAEKMEELCEKFDRYAEGEKDLNEGIKKMVKSGKKLAKGVKDYSSGADTLANGVTSYVKGAKQVAEGNKNLYQAVKDMPNSYAEFSKGIQSYTTGVDALANPETSKKLQAGASSVSAGITTLNESLSTLQTTYENYSLLVTGIKQQAENVTDATQKATILAYADQIQQLAEQQKAAIEKMAAQTGEESALKTGANQVSEGISQVLNGASELSQNSGNLRSADTQMTTSIQSLVSSIEKLKDGGQKLSNNDEKMLAGAKAILKASKRVNKGGKKLVNGVDKLKKGSNQVDRATGKVADGIEKLKDGSRELYEGVEKFDEEGIQKINDMYEEDFVDVKERLLALLDISSEYNNFSGIDKGMDGNVKFIIETEEIGNADEE